jgi:hypothetical protein
MMYMAWMDIVENLGAGIGSTDQNIEPTVKVRKNINDIDLLFIRTLSYCQLYDSRIILI